MGNRLRYSGCRSNLEILNNTRLKFKINPFQFARVESKIDKKSQPTCLSTMDIPI
jgi:hypothetical protein